MKTIKGGYQIQILNGVLHLNTVEGCVLRIAGLPKKLAVDESSINGQIRTCMIGT